MKYTGNGQVVLSIITGNPNVSPHVQQAIFSLYK